MMNEARARDTGRLAIATGAVAIGSATCLATFFAVGGPFGTINDVGNATLGVLSGWLAWRLRDRLSGRPARVALGACLAGAGLAIAGSALVISQTTGFFLAGLVSSVGFAGIGAWVIALNRSATTADVWPPRLRALGLVAGALMVTGIVAVPGIVQRLDDMDTAPGWVWVAFIGWTATFVVYPAWAIWLGTVEMRRAGQSNTVGAASWTGS